MPAGHIGVATVILIGLLCSIIIAPAAAGYVVYSSMHEQLPHGPTLGTPAPLARASIRFK